MNNLLATVIYFVYLIILFMIARIAIRITFNGHLKAETKKDVISSIVIMYIFLGFLLPFIIEGYL